MGRCQIGWVSVPGSLPGFAPCPLRPWWAGKASAECFDDLPPRHLAGSKPPRPGATSCLSQAIYPIAHSFFVAASVTAARRSA